jgi:hypothetical protein
MVYVYWILAGLTGFLLAASALCWGIFIAMDSPDWHKLGVKLFRFAKMSGLLLFNLWIWTRVIGLFF